MVDKNFFDLLKDKLATLRPMEQYRKDDWAALGERLNAALPPHPRKRRRAIVLPLLLVAALLSSNAVWWKSSHSDRATLVRLHAQIADLQALVSASPATVSPVVVRTDTVWRTIYVQQDANQLPTRIGDVAPRKAETGRRLVVLKREAIRQLSADATMNSLGPYGLEGKTTEGTNIATTDKPDQQQGIELNADDSVTQLAALPNLEMRQVALLELPERKILLPQNLMIASLNEEKVTEAFGQNLLDALRPKYLQLGANIGWLYAQSAGLIHEGGFSYSVQGVAGLSRHWSLTAAYSAGQLHYKAHDPTAVLSAPTLPTPHLGYHLTEIDVTGQKIRQFNLGLRYTFAQPGRPRPYLGLSWGGQTLLPFTIEYEIEHELTGTIQKDVFEITTRTYLRHILGLNAGLDIPLSSRFGLTLEGIYQRPWKKPSDTAPDLVDIRAGVNWLF